jgi:hypothetical protein
MSTDPTEARRRELLPEVNQPAHDALATAGAMIIQAAEAAGTTEVTDEEAQELLRARDDMAEELLRAQLEAQHGKDNVFNTKELSEHFEPVGFAAPMLVVRRLVDNQLGSLYFTHRPRLYYGFQADKR